MADAFQIDRSDPERTLHCQLVEGLSKEFAALPPNTRIPAGPALVKRFGVASMTVVRALAELVERGEIVRINGKGSFIANRRVQTIYVLTPCPVAVWNLDTAVLDGAIAEAKTLGIAVRTIYATRENISAEPDFESLGRIPPRSAVLAPNVWYFHCFDFLRERQANVVLIGQNYFTTAAFQRRYPLWKCLDTSYLKMVKTAVAMLAAAGRRRILLLHAATMWMDSIRHGYREGLAEAGLEYLPELELCINGKFRLIRDEFAVLMVSGVQFDAVVTQFPEQALAVLEELTSQKIAVPKTVSLVSLKEHALLNTAPIGITAFDCDLFDLGCAAVRLLAGKPDVTEPKFKIFRRQSAIL